jgi:signal peptidase I
VAQKKLTDVVWESLNGREPETEDSVFKEVISWLCIISVAVLLAFLLNNFVIVNAKVTSGSMESTIMTGDRVLGLRASYWFDQPQFGDVVFFRYPDDERKIYVKRVIGVPGDTIEIKGGIVYRNGQQLDEPYLNETPQAQDYGPYQVPDNSYFMLGDNRNNSLDSRYWEHTFVSRGEILGKAYYIYYPRFQSIRRSSL